MYHVLVGPFASTQPTGMLCFLRVSKFEDGWQRALRSANLFKFTSRRAEHVNEWNETSTGKLDPSAFGYPQDAQMSCSNRIALMRRLLKSDSEEENEEGDDRIDDEEKSPKMSFKVEAAGTMDAAESPEDMIPLPQVKMELDQSDPRDVN